MASSIMFREDRVKASSSSSNRSISSSRMALSAVAISEPSAALTEKLVMVLDTVEESRSNVV